MAANSHSGWLSRQPFMPPVDQRLLVTPARFVANDGPAYLAYYAMAVLVLLPGTRLFRITLLPISLWLLFRAGTSLDMSAGDPGLNFNNCTHATWSFAFAMRVVDWALLVKEPLQRVPGNKYGNLFWNAFDLTWNFRGIGWTWGSPSNMPNEYRPTHSRRAFLFASAPLWLAQWIAFDALLFAVQSFTYTPSSGVGGSIFDPTLPPLQRYARATSITLLNGGFNLVGMELTYVVCALVGLLSGLFPDPASWPPLFDAPWLTTSLSELWSRRWHQFFRRSFKQISVRPLARVFGAGGALGRASGVVGAFMLSGIMHDFHAWSLGQGSNFTRIGGFFCSWASASGWRVHGKA